MNSSHLWGVLRGREPLRHGRRDRVALEGREHRKGRWLDGRYARASGEAYALIREALTASGDICPGPGQLLIRLDPLTAPGRTGALARYPCPAPTGTTSA